MSMYNEINGVNELVVFFILPMLGNHTNDYPRFRDAFLMDEEHPEYDNHIHVYTRCGGGNRNCGMGEEKLLEHENYVADFDDSFDSTYASYVFSVPEKWKSDFDKIINNNLKSISDEYKEQIYDVFPKIKQQVQALLKE